MKFVFINTGSKQMNAGIIRCLGLGKELVQRGHEVVILISNDYDNISAYGNSFEGIHFIYTTNRAGGFEQIHKIYQLILQKDVDIVHCMGAGTSIFLPALIVKLIFRKKFQLIVDYEDKQVLMVPLKKRKLHFFYEYLSFKFANKIICASQVLMEEYQHKNPRTYYLPFAVEPQHVQINKLLKTSNCMNIGYLGSINEAYRDQIEYIISILPLLIEKFKDVAIHIAGTGGLLDYFVKKVKELGFEKSISFYGFVADDQLPSFFSKIDLMLFYFPDTPLNRYRCPNKVFLCCSYGISLVTNKVGEIGKVLENYPRAAFFEGENDFSCISAIEIVRTVESEVSQVFYDENNWSARVDKYLGILAK